MGPTLNLKKKYPKKTKPTYGTYIQSIGSTYAPIGKGRWLVLQYYIGSDSYDPTYRPIGSYIASYSYGPTYEDIGITYKPLVGSIGWISKTYICF